MQLDICCYKFSQSQAFGWARRVGREAWWVMLSIRQFAVYPQSTQETLVSLLCISPILFIVRICCSTYSIEKPYCCCYVNKWIWTSYDLVSFNYWTGIATGKWFVVLVMLSHWSPWGKYGSWFWDQTCLSMLWEPSGIDRKLIWTWGSSLYYGWTWS